MLPYVAFLTTIRDEPWRGLAGSLTTSSTITCLPVFVVGLLFLVAALLMRFGKPRGPADTSTPPQPPVPEPAVTEARRG
jgi:hypothetical protein